MERTGGDYDIGEGFGLLIYDLPAPKERPSREVRTERDKLLKAWKNWYDSVSTKLSCLGYKLQYSVVVVSLDEKTLKEVEEVRQYATESLEKLWEMDRLKLIPRKRPDIKVVQFKPSSAKDAELLVQLFKQSLLESLQHLKDLIMAWLRDQRPKEYMEAKVRDYLRKLRSQDRLGMLEKDEELRQLLNEIEVLSL
jgi:hypothetical protein